MIPGEFDYFSPPNLPEATALLEKYGDGAKVLAGDQSLISAMRFRKAPVAYVEKSTSDITPSPLDMDS